MSSPRTFKSINVEQFKKAVETVAREDNVPTLSFPSEEGSAPEPSAPQPQLASLESADTAVSPVTELAQPQRRPRPVRKITPAPTERVAVDLPVYLIDAIRKKAAEDNVTRRYLYLKAFRSSGFTIQDVDMMEDGRRDN